MPSANLIIEKIIEIGPIFILPSILFLASLITIKSLKDILLNFLNCLYIFLGTIGLSIAITLYINFFNPIIESIKNTSTKQFTVIDGGWIISEKIIFNTDITLCLIIAFFALNILMLLTHLTRTINIDLWNWWILIVIGSLIYYITAMKWLGIFLAVLISGITLVFSDIYGPNLEKYFKINAVTNTQPQLVVWSPITQFVNFIINQILSIFKKIYILIKILFTKFFPLYIFKKSKKSIQKNNFKGACFKLFIYNSFFTEPLIAGFLLGFIIGIILKLKTINFETKNNILFAIGYGVYLSVIFFILPKMNLLIIKGLKPIVNNIVEFINKKITKRKIHIGVDALIFVGNPAVIYTSLILIPFTAYIATLLPGNKILPSADLVLIPLLAVWVISQSKGNIIRAFLSCVLIIPLTLWISTDMSKIFVSFFNKNNLEFLQSASQDVKNFSSYNAGSNWLFWIILQIIKPVLEIFK